MRLPVHQVCKGQPRPAELFIQPDAEIMQGDAVEKVKALKVKEGKNIVLWGSISLAQSLMKAELIDEYHIQVCPTIIGVGRKLFLDTDEYRQLKLKDVKKYDTGVVWLSYER